MRGTVTYPTSHLRIVRLFLGGYFIYLTAGLIPYAERLFAQSGWLPPSLLQPPYANFFSAVDGRPWPTVYLFSLLLAALGFFIGWGTRLLAAYLWAGLVCLNLRNPFQFDLDYDYVGWLMLAFAIAPKVDWTAREYEMPKWWYGGAWLVLACSYSASGIAKFLYWPWREGLIIQALLDLPTLSRFSLQFLRGDTWDLMQKMLTWMVLFAELFFLPLMLTRRTRRWAWLSMTAAQLGMATFLQLTMINVAILIFHGFVGAEYVAEALRLFARLFGKLYAHIFQFATHAPHFFKKPGRMGTDISHN